MIIDGARRFEDDDVHVALVARTLSLDVSVWRGVVTAWCNMGDSNAPEQRRLEDLTAAFHAATAAATRGQVARPCVVCGGRAITCDDDGVLCWLRCEACGHGALADGAAPRYDVAYYTTRTPTGVGYEKYLAERDYREQKGRALVQELMTRHGAAPRTLLDVGSAFGFTRAAARSLGLDAAGVDVNRAACETAMALYGFETTLGTTAAIRAETRFDIVLYQFVLEHVADVRAEVDRARLLSRRGGLVCFVVPSMDAVERRVFGARYRSYRADHLHVFSRASVTKLMADAGFTDTGVRSVCSLHLLHGFLSSDELDALYQRAEGPDLIVTARSP